MICIPGNIDIYAVTDGNERGGRESELATTRANENSRVCSGHSHFRHTEGPYNFITTLSPPKYALSFLLTIFTLRFYLRMLGDSNFLFLPLLFLGGADLRVFRWLRVVGQQVGAGAAHFMSLINPEHDVYPSSSNRNVIEEK